MAEHDKYPESSGRRRFVKGVVGSAAMAGIGTAAVAAADTLTHSSGTGGGQTTYYGVKNISGPAPRAMPMIPLKIDSEGYIKGVYPSVKTVTKNGRTVKVAKMEISGITYSVSWFQYCGVQTYDGLDPEYDGDNYFRYSGGAGAYDWQPSGGKMNIKDFSNYETWTNGIGEAGIGKPANGTWRSQNTDVAIPVQVIRSTNVGEMVKKGDGPATDFLKAATDMDAMAYLNKCTHFCCVPGYRVSTYQSAADKIYCPCHQSLYDPYTIVKRRFTAYPRPPEE